jgi:hypothetical protein
LIAALISKLIFMLMNSLISARREMLAMGATSQPTEAIMHDTKTHDALVELGAASTLTHGDERLEFTEAFVYPDHWDKP